MRVISFYPFFTPIRDYYIVTSECTEPHEDMSWIIDVCIVQKIQQLVPVLAQLATLTFSSGNQVTCNLHQIYLGFIKYALYEMVKFYKFSVGVSSKLWPPNWEDYLPQIYQQ